MYFEVYQNVFDKYEKRNLAQIITNIIHQRPRFDLESNYFTLSYRLEVSCLYKQTRILKIVLDRMIDDMRSLLEKCEPDSKYGMPYSLIKKVPINLTSNSFGSTLNNFYMLEFHPCLAVASRMPPAFKQSIEVSRFSLAYFKELMLIFDFTNRTWSISNARIQLTNG